MKLNGYMKISLITLSVSLFSNTNLHCAARLTGSSTPGTDSSTAQWARFKAAILKQSTPINSKNNPLLDIIYMHWKDNQDNNEIEKWFADGFRDGSEYWYRNAINRPEGKLNGLTPLQLASALHRSTTAALPTFLIAMKADPHLPDMDGYTAMDYARIFQQQ